LEWGREFEFDGVGVGVGGCRWEDESWVEVVN